MGHGRNAAQSHHAQGPGVVDLPSLAPVNQGVCRQVRRLRVHHRRPRPVPYIYDGLCW